MAAIGQVGTSSQHSYEAGTNRPDCEYLANITKAGADALHIITGEPPRQETDWIAVLEIVDLVRQWSARRAKPMPPEDLAHFVQVFYEQYEAKRRLELDHYAATLRHVG